jgi:translation initiation factor IF-2
MSIESEKKPARSTKGRKPAAKADKASAPKRPVRKTVGKISSDSPETNELEKVAPVVATPQPKPEPEPSAEPAPVKASAERGGSEETGPPAPGGMITMKGPIVVKDLATRIGLKPFQVVHELMEMNIFATLNQHIDEEVARTLCEKQGFQFQIEKREKGGGVHREEKVIEAPPPPPLVEENLQHRPPVITFMGHVDHGKTSLLDAIRQTKVVDGEAGGITQHIGAYTVKRDGKAITFLDTPGHEAFTAMRARGAQVTDIVVIVVAADDGLMPQTLEAIQHAKAALAANPNHFSIMVAINKIDAPGANPEKVKGQLQEHGLIPEEWGGETLVCEVSALKKVGIEKLLENMLLQAEILELKAEPTGPARGVVIESQIDPGRGPNATIIVQHGKLKIGDAFICGPYWGRVKALVNDLGQPIKEAGPSTPVKVLGFDGSPTPGEQFTVMKNDREARQLSEDRQASRRLDKLGADRPVTLENIFATLKEGQKKTLPLILKSDVQGSLEAIVESLKKIKTEKISIDFVLVNVGPISANDVLLAKASGAVIIGFNTKTDNVAAAAAKREGVQIKLFSIIYELIDQVKEAMAGMLDPEVRESQIGTALVKKVFSLSKFPVAGCIVESGRISRSGRARVVRKKVQIYDGNVQTLKRFQDDVNEVRNGMECGIRLGNFNEYLEGDIIECYVLEKVAQTL